MALDVVILAAGEGTRMRSSLPKVLHNVAGKPMLQWVIDAARACEPASMSIIVGHAQAQVCEAVFAEDITFVHQAEQKGTGHAVQQALPHLKGDRVLVLYGDVPLVSVKSLARLMALPKDVLGLMTVHLADPSGYGRIVRTKDDNNQDKIEAIVEHKDANESQRLISEVNTGIMLIPAIHLSAWLSQIQPNNQQGELYLTDIIAIAVKQGIEVTAIHPDHAMEVQGANDKIQLSQLECYWQYELAMNLMRQGVTLTDPHRIDVRGTLKVGRDVFIDANVIFEGQVTLGDGVHIGANCIIKDSHLHDHVQVKAFSHIEGADMRSHSDCGPYARLRAGSLLHEHAHVGNFVELKNTQLGPHAKAGHLSYLGDAEIGARSNIGAGTITCNYDGANKHKTTMGEDVFVGSNSSLVAPIKLGKGSTTGAGSTITEDVPAETLAVGRARQSNIKGWKRPVK